MQYRFIWILDIVTLRPVAVKQASTSSAQAEYNLYRSLTWIWGLVEDPWRPPEFELTSSLVPSINFLTIDLVFLLVVQHWRLCTEATGAYHIEVPDRLSILSAFYQYESETPALCGISEKTCMMWLFSFTGCVSAQQPCKEAAGGRCWRRRKWTSCLPRYNSSWTVQFEQRISCPSLIIG